MLRIADGGIYERDARERARKKTAGVGGCLLPKYQSRLNGFIGRGRWID